MQVRIMKRWLSTVLALAMAIAVMVPTTALAADEVVTGVKLVGYDTEPTETLYIDEDPVQLTMVADIQGSSSQKNVTDLATWTAQYSSIVKVEKGKLTALKEGTSIVTGTYMTKPVTIKVTVVNLYNSLDIGVSGTVEVELGAEDITLNATVNKVSGGTENVNGSAIWTTSDSDVVMVDKGKLTFKREGTAKITAKYKSVSDSVEYKVKSPYSKIEILPAYKPVELQLGQSSFALTAEATLVNSTSTQIITDEATWKSSNESVVTVDKGLLKQVGRGSAKVTVQHRGKSAEIDVVVRLPYLVMELDPDRQEVIYFLNDPDTTQPKEFKAFVRKDPNPANKVDVTHTAAWTASEPLVATVSGGIISPKSYGNTKITASYLGLSKDIQVEVYKPLVELTIEKDSVSMFKKESASLPKVTGKLLDGDQVDFTSKLDWSSSDEDIIKIAAGKLVAGVPGTATVTGELNKRAVEFEVTVQEKVLALISKEATFSLIVGSDAANLPVVKSVSDDGTIEDNVSDKMEWKTTSSNLLIKDGTLLGLVSGRASLTGTYLNKTITLPVMMEDKIEKFTVEPVEIELNFKRSKSIKVTGTYANGKTTTLSSKLNWTSSDESVATVKGSTVKALEKIGLSTLTASYQGTPITVTVNVTAKLTKLQADETRLTLGVGQSGKTDITAFFENNTYKIVNTDATWTSSKPTYVTVDSSGNIKALKKGTASIKATYKGKTITVSVTVK